MKRRYIESEQDPHRYDDMLEMERPVSKKHPPMDRIARAAQFAPFAALNGYEEQIEDTALQNEQAVALRNTGTDPDEGA